MPDDAAPSAPTLPQRPLGILTGISFQSGIDYYRNINERFMQLVPKHPDHPMPPNPLITMVSADCGEYAGLLCAKRWAEVREYFWSDARMGRLVDSAGEAEFFVIASNTAHMILDEAYGGKCYYGRNMKLEDIKPRFLHIADVTARAILTDERSRTAIKDRSAGPNLTIGLLGTEPTMREDYLKRQLLKHKGIGSILVPDTDEELHQIFQYIMHELGMPSKYDDQGRPVFKPETKRFFVEQARKLYARGCTGGIILGCTEIELVLRQEDVGEEIHLFPSAELHIEAAAKVAAGCCELSEFLP